MNGSLDRLSVQDKIVQTLKSPAQVLHWQAVPTGTYCKEGEYIVGASYLLVAIYMQSVFIFKCLI